MFRRTVLFAFLVLAGAIRVFSQSPIAVDFGARAGLPFSITIESKLTGVVRPDQLEISVGLSLRH
jgi:hypothetical protein